MRNVIRFPSNTCKKGNREKKTMETYGPIIRNATEILHGGDYNPDQWLETPEIIDRDFELMEKSGCNTFSVGIFSWTMLEPAPGKYQFAI